MNEPQLGQKVVLITGAAGALGSALCESFASEGARLALLGRDRQGLDALVGRLASTGTDALPLPCDVTDEDAVSRAFSEAVDHHGRVDVVINSAGVFRSGPVHEAPRSDWDLCLQVNLTGPYLVARAAARHWLGAGIRGHLVNIASVGARHGFADLTAYCASKAGLAGLSRALAEELRPHGIRVTIVYPHAMSADTGGIEPESAERFQVIEPATVASLIVQAASVPAWAAVEELVVSPQATSLEPRMIEPGA